MRYRITLIYYGWSLFPKKAPIYVSYKLNIKYPQKLIDKNAIRVDIFVGSSGKEIPKCDKYKNAISILIGNFPSALVRKWFEI